MSYVQHITKLPVPFTFKKVLNVHFSGIKYVHNVIQLSSSSISRHFTIFILKFPESKVVIC